MKKIITAVMGTISGLVLLFSYHTSTNAEAAASPATDTASGTDEATASATPNATATTSPTADTGSTGSGSTGGSTTGDTSGSSSAASGTFTGDAVNTEWGVVQVQITVADGKITAAEAIQYPDENPKDQRINAYALPILNSEAVAAQSASIDAVSGATVTSNGYTESLQSALDAAHLG